MAVHDTFQVAVKALNYNEEGKLLFLKDYKGEWDFPGGRIEHDESLREAMEREVREELNVKCSYISAQPLYVWPGQNTDGAWRVDVCFKVDFESCDFTPSNENVEHGYFTLDDAKKLNLCSHLNGLKEII
jgi:8-oxo-dGTP pyrophosphatase MutT (NUDIX family)